MLSSFEWDRPHFGNLVFISFYVYNDGLLRLVSSVASVFYFSFKSQNLELAIHTGCPIGMGSVRKLYS